MTEETQLGGCGASGPLARIIAIVRSASVAGIERRLQALDAPTSA
jgi:hypothetical protein